MKFRKFILLPSFATNTYLVWDEKSKEAVLIDPAAPGNEVVDFAKSSDLNVKYIINTHGHGDHIGGNEYFKKKLNAKICVHKADAEMLINPEMNLSQLVNETVNSPKADIILKDKDILKFGGLSMKIIHTPGHTKGCCCLKVEDKLFSGDTLFAMGIGRTDLPGGSFKEIENSIKNIIFKLDGDLKVLPGHGPASSLEDERVGNPYFGLMK